MCIHSLCPCSRGEFHGSLRRDKAAVSTENTSTQNTNNKPSVRSLSLCMYTVILSAIMSKCVLLFEHTYLVWYNIISL